MSYKEIVLAAWLHDIGKFAQRAGAEGSGNHQNYTEKFLQGVKDCLPNDIDAGKVITLASKHHNPSEFEEGIIAHGDRLSNGAGECKLENKNDEAPVKPLVVHPATNLRLKGKNGPDPSFISLKPMESKTIFPLDKDKVKAGKQEYQEEYQALWKDFDNDFRALKGLQFKNFILSLDTLMERYCWCIPSSPLDDDISLYQHSKLAAAFSGTLYLYHHEKGSKTEAALNADDEKFLFIQGDMSGIQKYIFDLKTTKDNAKLLRARSFQVWALSEIIAEHLAMEFGVSPENIITSSGGKFLLLAPNTDSVTKKLPDLRRNIELYFLKDFAGIITFVLSGGVPAKSSDLQKGNVKKLLDKIGMEGDGAKQKKMQAALGVQGHVLTELYNDLQKYGGVCGYCGTLPADYIPPKYKLEDQSEEIKKSCKNCNELIEIGRILLKANKEANKIIFKPEKLSQPDGPPQPEKLPHFHDMIDIIEKEDEGFGYLTKYVPGKPLISLPYAAPFNNNEPCTFKDIADKAGDKDKGDKKLAMFKADVDNLGLIFTSSWVEGEDNNISLSRYAQLSRRLHYFFSAFIADFISNNKDHPEYKENIYTVFSGGDDLCIIGAWNTIMHFASDFRKYFSKFTNNNPSVTLSGGIAMFGPRLPVMSAVAMAEEALDEAKKRKEGNETVKDGISVFGVTLSWKEYDKSLEDAKEIIDYMTEKQDQKPVSAAVVYKMIDFANRAKKAAKNATPRDLAWMGNYRYIIARNIDPKNTKAVVFFQKFAVCPERMEKSRVAVSYALYMKRPKKED